MIERYGGIIEGALTAIIVLGFCAYQYWATNRSIERDKASARDAGHAEGEHQLDDRRDETVH
jgi:uncharacterized membrane protein YebE (DUF533 family)